MMIGSYDFADEVGIEGTRVIGTRRSGRRPSRGARVGIAFGVVAVMAAGVFASSMLGVPVGTLADRAVAKVVAVSGVAPSQAEASVPANAVADGVASASDVESRSEEDARLKAEAERKRSEEAAKAEAEAKAQEAAKADEQKRLEAASATIAYDKRGLRVAHRCNVSEAVAAAEGSWGVEADVREADGAGDVKLYQTEDGEYRLSELLSACKGRGQVVILDMKEGSDAPLVVTKVREAGMLANVRFQVSSVEAAKRLHDVDANCLVWLLVDAGADRAQALSTLGSSSALFCGINVCGAEFEPEEATRVAGLVHGIKGSVGKPMELCVHSTESSEDVYGRDEAYAEAGVNMLMCGKVFLVP